MIIKTIKLAVLASALSFAGCSTIHFENGPVVPDPVPDMGFDWTMGVFDEDPSLRYDAASSVRYRRWYHHAIFSIAELSNPLQTGLECSGLEWNQITTEVTFLDFVAGLADNLLLYNASSMGLDLWSPWSIEYSCR
jgi:hypothetical protein